MKASLRGWAFLQASMLQICPQPPSDSLSPLSPYQPPRALVPYGYLRPIFGISWACIDHIFAIYIGPVTFTELFQHSPTTSALCVKGGPWIKRSKKNGKSKPPFLIQKIHQFIFAALFEFLVSQFFNRKKLDDISAENLTKIKINVKKGWIRPRWVTIFCRVKI